MSKFNPVSVVAPARTRRQHGFLERRGVLPCLAICLALPLLAACGQRGPLVLPAAEPGVLAVPGPPPAASSPRAP